MERRKALHLGTEFEKSALLLELEDITSGQHFILGNTHPGLEQQTRLDSMRRLVKHLSGIEMPICLVGDFNQFDATNPLPAVYPAQIAILTEAGFKFNSEYQLHNGMKGTFIAFPYDIFRFLSVAEKIEFDALKDAKNYQGMREFFIAACDKYGTILPSTCLDGVFTRGFSSDVEVKAKPITWFYGSKINVAKPENTAGVIQAGFLRYFRETTISTGGVSPLPSDHVAESVRISFMPKVDKS